MWNHNELSRSTTNHMGEAIDGLVFRLLGIILEIDLHAKALLEHRRLKWVHEAEDGPYVLQGKPCAKTARNCSLCAALDVSWYAWC